MGGPTCNGAISDTVLLNRKSEMQDGGAHNVSTHISAIIYDSNIFPTAITMLSGSSITTGLIRSKSHVGVNGNSNMVA